MESRRSNSRGIDHEERLDRKDLVAVCIDGLVVLGGDAESSVTRTYL